ncbi:MAG: hypothetical protein IKK59_05595 [Lachnospiraceae bacterium]|nr:hypothetical protein [Lachnospiraceae bacterium]
MKLYYKDDNEKLIELDKAVCVTEGDIVVHTTVMLSKEKRKELERELINKFERNVIVLDGLFDEIMVVPPKNNS